MSNYTVISYPSEQTTPLLSLTESRSLYMLPFGGRFRIIDFTIRNSTASKVQRTLIFNSHSDELKEYVSLYSQSAQKSHSIRVVSKSTYANPEAIYKLLSGLKSKYFIIYNGDTPSIIDFNTILDKFHATKSKPTLFMLNINKKPSMAYKVLVIPQKELLKIIKKAIKENHNPPCLFEMVMNVMINKGVKKAAFTAKHWPIKNVPGYYNTTFKFAGNSKLIDSLFEERIIQSQITSHAPAHISLHGNVKNSFVSDSCIIEGTVENSILYPGVEIGEKTVIKNSIILPNVKIGCDVYINRSILDERTEFDPENTHYNIENSCKIGTSSGLVKNEDFPKSLFSSLTLIGKNTHISNEARIGAACYIASGLNSEYFLKKRFIYDGASALVHPQ